MMIKNLTDETLPKSSFLTTHKYLNANRIQKEKGKKMLKEIDKIEDINEQIRAEDRFATALYNAIHSRKKLMKILFNPNKDDYLFAVNEKLFRFLEYIAESTDLMVLVDKLQYYLYVPERKMSFSEHLTEKELYRALEREVNLKNNCKKGGRPNNVENAIYLCLKDTEKIYNTIKWIKDKYDISERSIYRIKRGLREKLKPNCKKMFCMFELQERIAKRNELTSPQLYNWVP